MKTEEDEAFEDIERRQGGFKAKQGMAMHKTQDQNICRHYKQWQHCHICDLESQVAELEGIKAALAQSAQEPVAHVYLVDHEGRPRIAWDNAKGIKIGDKLYTALPQRPWVGLTDDELADLWYKESLDWMEFARAHEAALKEKNNGT